MPAPLDPMVRAAIVWDMRAGFGCNAIARTRGVSPGTVSKIARQEGHFFARSTQTALAARNRRADCAIARIEREATLTEELMDLPQTARQRDGRETRAFRRISYRLYDLHRHHS
ncbi:hypothetical protein [Microbacterium aerolatum]|uniref:hypothetical protein n=1 Tax=Microbacterium aerolatum TaxID=153731 RepID=UPI0038514D3A